MALVVEEEECLVTLLVETRNVDWAAKRDPKLIAMRIRLRLTVKVVEVGVGVELAIAQVVVRISVQTAASRFGDDVDDVPGAPAILRR